MTGRTRSNCRATNSLELAIFQPGIPSQRLNGHDSLRRSEQLVGKSEIYGTAKSRQTLKQTTSLSFGLL